MPIVVGTVFDDKNTPCRFLLTLFWPSKNTTKIGMECSYNTVNKALILSLLRSTTSLDPLVRNTESGSGSRDRELFTKLCLKITLSPASC